MAAAAAGKSFVVIEMKIHRRIKPAACFPATRFAIRSDSHRGPRQSSQPFGFGSAWLGFKPIRLLPAPLPAPSRAANPSASSAARLLGLHTGSVTTRDRRAALKPAPTPVALRPGRGGRQHLAWISSFSPFSIREFFFNKASHLLSPAAHASSERKNDARQRHEYPPRRSISFQRVFHARLPGSLLPVAPGTVFISAGRPPAAAPHPSPRALLFLPLQNSGLVTPGRADWNRRPVHPRQFSPDTIIAGTTHLPLYGIFKRACRHTDQIPDGGQ